VTSWSTTTSSAITGNATDKSVLEDAGIDRPTPLVATTSDDAVNLMTCWLAKRYNVRNVVSIVNQKEHSEPLQRGRGEDQREPGRNWWRPGLYYWARSPNLQAGRLDPRRHHLRDRRRGWCADSSTAEIRELDVRDFVFIAIRRAGGDLIIPSGAVRIRPGDVITVFTKKEAEGETIKTLNKQLKRSA